MTKLLSNTARYGNTRAAIHRTRFDAGVKAFQSASGETYQDIADATGVGRQTINNLMCTTRNGGRNTAEKATIVTLCDHIGATYSLVAEDL